jgi:hypothetical protein
MITTALLGLALAAAPVEDIAAQFGAETQATNVSCTSYDVTYCYGVGPDGAVVGAIFADGAFIPLGAAVAPAAAVPTTVAAAAPAVAFGDGIWLVGTDMAPGNYRATIDSAGLFDFCDYSRLSDLSGGTIEDYHESGEGEQVLVTIAPTDFAFETNGCGEWTPV